MKKFLCTLCILTLASGIYIKDGFAEQNNSKVILPVISRSPGPADYLEEIQSELTKDELLTPNEFGEIDIRSSDVSDINFLDKLDLLMKASFDSKTKWPELLPKGFDKDKIMELGKNPGLGIRELHKQGITGKGIGIGIIDQTLLVDHEEYGDRLRFYEEYNSQTKEPAQPHGAAVASIALGKTVGVAPSALLYFIADDAGYETENGYIRDITYCAEDINRFIELNKTLPEDEKIRIISMSIGWKPNDKGTEKMKLAIESARKEGIEVIWVSSTDELAKTYGGISREDFSDFDNVLYANPGIYLEKYIYNGEYDGEDYLLVPMDKRCIASPTGKDDYVYYYSGGSSWRVPYVAGLYALACQVKPDITLKEFTEVAYSTAYEASYVKHEGKEYKYGYIINPKALIEKLQ